MVSGSSYWEKPWFILLMLMCVSAMAYAQTSSPVMSLSEANKLISSSISPPDFYQSQQVSLPDRWQHERDGFYGSVWYELDFTLEEEADEQWAIYLPTVNMNADVWLNATHIGSGGNMQAPVSRYWNAPMMFVFSPSDMKKINKLLIRVVAYANEFGQMGRVGVGPHNAIESIYSRDFFSTVTIHVISGALAGVYALFIAMVWWRRKDPIFFWGSLVCAAWSFSSMNMYVVNPLMPELMWEKLMQISMGWIPLLFFFFIMRLDGITYRKNFDGVILFFAALINIVLLLVPRDALFLISRSWHLIAMFFAFIGVLRVFYSWIKFRRRSQLFMLIAFGLIAACGTHDILVQNQMFEHNQILWLDYSVPAILLLIGYLMVSHFLQAVKNSEELNQELDNRVKEAQKTIEADYEKILMLETEQASNKERERIYRDMHDDMGAKLLSMVYKAESDEMHSLARSAMNDLRAIVSKKPGEKHRLIDALDNWQRVSRKRCEEAGCAFLWQQEYIPEDIALTAESEQNLHRVQSEAITNIIKHNRASSIRITVSFRLNCLRVVINDDGDYSQLSHWLEGRGMSSMRYRVKQLSGKIRWREKPGAGGQVSWIIPLEKNQEAL